jgi:hypothetical protein
MSWKRLLRVPIDDGKSLTVIPRSKWKGISTMRALQLSTTSIVAVVFRAWSSKRSKVGPGQVLVLRTTPSRDLKVKMKHAEG